MLWRRTAVAEPALHVDTRDGVQTIAINRPQVMNALDDQTYRALANVFRQAELDESVRCLVLTSTGEHFCAGWDLSQADTPNNDSDNAGQGGYDAFLGALEACHKPVVAGVRGVAVGIGFTLLGHMDLVVFGESARMRAPFVALGLGPEAGSSVTLPSLLGQQLTADLMYTGRWLKAGEAVQAGLGIRAVPDDQLAETIGELARIIAAQPAESLIVTKQLLTEDLRARAVRARKVEDDHFRRLLQSPAHQRAVEAWKARSK
jgi:enoyl-CoA hydratase/carnithine racemase